ncbi:hypothetical protein JZU46_01075 [bacterium]|jgi:hypothetical protein|nr:hypothetical protein [bacterium]
MDEKFLENPITKNLVRGVIRTIGKEKISNAIDSIIKSFTAQKNSQLLEGETDIVWLIFEKENEAYATQVSIIARDGETRLSRQIATHKISDLIKTGLEQL